MTREQLSELQIEASKCLEAIRKALTLRAVCVNDNTAAWGQFLDTASGQIGVYGTSIAVQSLMLTHEWYAKHPRDLELAMKGANWLAQQYQDPDSKANHKGDFCKVPKVAYLIRGLSAAGSDTSILHDACTFLTTAQLQHGWGWWFCDQSRKDDSSHVIPTCLALSALKHFQDFKTSEGYSNALAWLIHQVNDDTKWEDPRKAGSLALAVNTLLELGLAPSQPAMQKAKQLLAKLCQQPAAWEVDPNFYSFTPPGQSAEKNEYLHLVPAPLVLSAMLSFDIENLLQEPFISGLGTMLNSHISEFEKAPNQDVKRIPVYPCYDLASFCKTFIKCVEKDSRYLLIIQSLDEHRKRIEQIEVSLPAYHLLSEVEERLGCLIGLIKSWGLALFVIIVTGLLALYEKLPGGWLVWVVSAILSIVGSLIAKQISEKQRHQG